jgi:hypothetical protein
MRGPIATAPAEDLLNAALYAATSAVFGVHYMADDAAMSPAATAALARSEAEAAAEPFVSRIIAHGRLRQAVVRALAREAAELVREGWHLAHPSAPPVMPSGHA